MRRILLLIPSMAGVGGTERMVHSLSGLFAGAGCEVHQASFDAPSVQRHFDNATPLHALGPIPRLPLPLRPISYVLSAWRLHQLKQRLGIDVTISNLWGADLISALSGGRDHKVALCHINIIGNSSNRLMMRFRPLVAALYRRFDRVIAVSESLAEELQALYHLDSHRAGHIDNFVDRPAAVSCIPADGIQRFVWCGRFSPEKNLAGLLHAWASFAHTRTCVQLVLLGDGPQHEEMLALAESLGMRTGSSIHELDRQVVFAGRVSDPAAWMLGARAMLLSSLAEGLPMVVLEALSLGLPVLSSDCQAGGVRTALSGEGICDPDRADNQATPAGMLLPVPRKDVPASLLRWREALDCAANDDARVAAWQRGALERAALFSSAAALGKWDKVLNLESQSA